MTIARIFAKDHFKLIAKSGEIKIEGKAQFKAGKVIIYDLDIEVCTGDRLFRMVQGSLEDAFDVVSAVHNRGFHAIPPHIEIRVRQIRRPLGDFISECKLHQLLDGIRDIIENPTFNDREKISIISQLPDVENRLKR